jgi:hypothetical protein
MTSSASARKRQLELSYLPRMLGLTEQGPSCEVVAATDTGQERHLFLRLKRSIDILGSLALMILLLPLFATATLLVLLTSARLSFSGRSGPVGGAAVPDLQVQDVAGTV